MKILLPNMIKRIGRAGVNLHTQLEEEIRSAVRSNLSETHHSKCFANKGYSHIFVPLPLPSFDRSIGLRNVSSHGSKKRDPVLGGCDGVSRRRINHKATVLRRCRQIHVVDADAGASDNLEPPSRRLEHIAIDFGGAANDQSIAERDLSAELFGTQVVRAINVGHVCQVLGPAARFSWTFCSLTSGSSLWYYQCSFHKPQHHPQTS
ncbi:hypothetical protein CsSME_00053213 [Camellia sinensis var. sinensis]